MMLTRWFCLLSAIICHQLPETLSLDSSSGVIMPFWSDNGVVFLAGKGDGNIRYYELESDELHYLTEHKSIEPARGMTFVPRRCLNASENEIARAYKVTGNMVQPISFYVPRRAESFQSDIFPPAPSSIPSLNAGELFGGSNKSSEPKYISLEDGAGVAGEAPPALTATPTPTAPTAAPAATSQASPNPASAASSRQTYVTETKPPPTQSTTAAEPAPSTEVTTQQESSSLPAPTRTSTVSSSPAVTPTVEPMSYVKSNGKGTASINENGGNFAELEAELFKLKSDLAEKDSIIRTLEMENEKLKTNEQRIRDALGKTW